MTSFPEENFYRVAHLVLDEIPSQLRKFFKDLWDTKYPSTPWDDTVISGHLFLARERNVKDKEILSNIQNGDTNKWDGTTLFAVLLYSSYNFLKADPNARTCIDNLRKLRNKCYGHLDSAKVEDPDYQQILQDAKNTFTQMGWPSTGILLIETRVLNTHDFLTLKNDLQQERERNNQVEIELNVVKEEVKEIQEKVEKVEENIEKRKSEATLAKESTGEAKIYLFETYLLLYCNFVFSFGG